MASIKFEDHIREQLQDREIQPSKDAWKKLNLKKIEPPKTNKKTTWYAIAASIISVIVVSSLIFRSQTTVVENTITNQENNILPIEKEKKIILNKTIEKAIVSEEKLEEEKAQKTLFNTSKTTKTKNNTIIAKTETIKSEINTTEIALENTAIIESELTTKNEEDLFEELKINEVVAQVKALQKENNSVTADEIDALLLQAQNEIYNKNLISKNKKVDATALLEMVETELETTFREKVFDALGEHFEKVRTAVVERNN